MRFFDNRFYDVFDVSDCQTEGHWILAFAGTKAEVEEVYDYVLTAKEDFYGEDYPDFVRDFEETKQFFVRKEGEWTPCGREDCKEKDYVLLRAHSLSPCDIERLEDGDLFFDLVDDTDSSSKIEEAYCIWPLDPKLNGYFCYRFLSYERPGFWIDYDYSVVLDRREGQIPPVIVDYAKFDRDEYAKTFVCGDVEIDFTAQEMLGVEWSE